MVRCVLQRTSTSRHSGLNKEIDDHSKDVFAPADLQSRKPRVVPRDVPLAGPNDSLLSDLGYNANAATLNADGGVNMHLDEEIGVIEEVLRKSDDVKRIPIEVY